MTKKYNTFSKKEILEQMEKLEGNLFKREFLSESQVVQGATENSGNITNKDTKSLNAKGETHTSTGQLAEKENEEESEETVEETMEESKFNTNNSSGKNLEQVTDSKEEIKNKNGIDDSGKVSNPEKGANAKDTWKLGKDNAKDIMNKMGKFFSTDRGLKSIQFNEETGKYEETIAKKNLNESSYGKVFDLTSKFLKNISNNLSINIPDFIIEQVAHKMTDYNPNFDIQGSNWNEDEYLSFLENCFTYLKRMIEFHKVPISSKDKNYLFISYPEELSQNFEIDKETYLDLFK